MSKLTLMKWKQIGKKVLLGLAVVFAGFLGAVAMQPDEFRVTRSTLIDAPPDVVFALVNDFHKWQAWSPWAKLDPNAKATFSGPAAGKGAKFAWAGDDKVGEGNMTITESKPHERILVDLEFIKPFAAKNLTEFSFNLDKGNTTAVTWTMTGTNNFMGKAFCLIMNMDKMVGGDFEKGLASMKAIAEAPRQVSSN